MVRIALTQINHRSGEGPKKYTKKVSVKSFLNSLASELKNIQSMNVSICWKAKAVEGDEGVGRSFSPPVHATDFVLGWYIAFT